MELRRVGTRGLALALAALVLAACSVQLRTAPTAVQGCDDALASGRLVADPRSGLALAGSTGVVMQILWPHGYSARREPTGIALIGLKGEVLAREGDFITAGGGGTADGVFAVCEGSVLVVPAPG